MILEAIFGTVCLFTGVIIGRTTSKNSIKNKDYFKKYIPIRWIQAQIDSHPGMASAMWTRLIDEWEKTEK